MSKMGTVRVGAESNAESGRGEARVEGEVDFGGFGIEFGPTPKREANGWSLCWGGVKVGLGGRGGGLGWCKGMVRGSVRGRRVKEG